MARQVLFIYNDPIAPEALLGEVFVERGFEIDTFTVVEPEATADPAFDVDFPDAARYDVIVPLGSRWSVYDDALRNTWVGTEMQLVRDALDAGAAVLGGCVGGQLVAQALGGTVARSPQPELGWYEIAGAEKSFIPAGPWFQWHFDRFTTPPGAVELARTAGATQAFIQGRAMGLQFHPELDGPLLELWLDDDRGRDDGDLHRLGLSEDDLRERTAAEQDTAAARLRALVDGFLTQAAAACLK